MKAVRMTPTPPASPAPHKTRERSRAIPGDCSKKITAENRRHGHIHDVDAKHHNTAEAEQNRLKQKRDRDRRKRRPPSTMPVSPFRIRWTEDGPTGKCTSEATKNTAERTATSGMRSSSSAAKPVAAAQKANGRSRDQNGGGQDAVGNMGHRMLRA